MNDHLRRLVKKDQREVLDIMPISLVDAEIISEVTIALKKLKIKELSDILDVYKKKKDEDIRDLLLTWNTNFRDVDEREDIENDEEDEPEPIIWFRFYGIRIRPSQLFLIEVDEIVTSSDSLIYQIILNRSEDSRTMYQNIHINFFSREERDRAVEELEERLEQCNIKFL